MADIVTSRVFVDGEKGITAAKLNDIVASSVIQPAFYTSKPTAGTADPTDTALILKSGAYAQVPVSTLGGSATQAQIWSTRLRSFNAIGNPNFEVTQRNCGAGVALPSGTFIEDRWNVGRAGTWTGTAASFVGGTGLVVPGTSYRISSRYLAITLTAQQASLGVTDTMQISQYIEGPSLRELISDVHSISLLVNSSVAGLKFSVYLRDSSPTQSLVKLCTLPTANTWTLITLPNLPVFPSGNFSILPGAIGYQIGICLAAGATLAAPSADIWQSGSFVGAPGMSNFAASPVNSTFSVAFIQHEPGAVCSTFIDKPFSQNLDECLRYFQKSYDYAIKPGTATFPVCASFMCANLTAAINGPAIFSKRMAKAPSLIGVYNPQTGAVNSVYRVIDGVAVAITAVNYPGETGFLQLAGTFGSGQQYLAQWTADTGW